MRTADGMLPTPRAQALIAPVRDALRALREIAEPPAAFDAATSTRPWRICMTDASHATLLPRLLATLRAHAPGAPVTAVRIDDATAAALQSGAADIAVGYIPWLDTGFYQQALFTQDWICLAGPHNTRIGATLTLRGYREAAHVVTAAGTGAADLEAARLPRLVRPFLQRLSTQTGETANLSVLDGHEVVYLERSNSPRVVSIGFHPGARTPAHVVSPGFAILSTFGRPQLDAWIAAHDFSRFTANTITDIDAFRETVGATARLGYSFVNQYIDVGLGGIAAALFDRHGRCAGAVSMTFQMQRYPEETALQQLLPALQDVVKVLREVI